MAYKLTEETVRKIEHNVVGGAINVFELNTDEERARIATWTEGVRDMADAIVYALKELK